MSKFKIIKLAHIKKAALKVAEAVRPEKIILFGSYAYGHPTPDSDVDFLLVTSRKSQKERDQIYDAASDVLIPRPFPLDLLVRSSKDIAWRAQQGDFFIRDIIEKGRVLYER